jgi:SAM-dependent methyltransferase
LPPDWQLPAGVPRGTWQYAHSQQVASGYDEEIAASAPVSFDLELVRRRFTHPGLVVDLGCGTGRLLVPLARHGFRGLGVDISPEMLAIARQKARAADLPIDLVMANMVQLDCLRDGIADYCISMFSTLGMIRGRGYRRQALRQALRILKPRGLLVLHVHNRWWNLHFPQGRRWLVTSTAAALWRRDTEPGDKFFTFRDVPQMFLHLYTRRELSADLESAGFQVEEMIPLAPSGCRALRCGWLLGRLRAQGWIAVARKP